jgi:hypothetical protein
VARWRKASATEPRFRSPSFHWADPTLALTPDLEEAPLLITVEYRVSDERASDFLVAMDEMRIFRRRGRRQQEPPSRPGGSRPLLETFVVACWS